MALNILKKWLVLSFFILQSAFALEFSYNGFNSSDVLLYGTAKLDSSHQISLTRNRTFSIGRALYDSLIPMKLTNKSKEVGPFSTSFTFSITPYKNLLPGHGLAFILVPPSSRGIQGAAASQHLGIVNATNDGDPNNHILAVEFDVFQNEEFKDMNDNHVGVDVNSVTSIVAHEAGYWSENGESQYFNKLKLNDGSTYRVWIDYRQKQLNVTMAPSTLKKPMKPLISIHLDLSGLVLDTMYAGFSASTGQLLESHEIFSWSFSNSN